MCGICGLISQQFEVDLEVIKQMNYNLTHRGPDGEGFYTVPHLAMAMRRLSIIDLNSGWQPLYNEDHSIAIIANGEIYNYVELRDELQKRGHCLSTKSDIETIAHLYEDHGLDCVKYLRGMFAFALWDLKKNRLVLARDRVGEKPLYLYETSDSIYFASEIRALAKTGKIKFEFDPPAVHLYFHYGYVPEPRTPIKGVRKLPGGHLLVVDVEPWSVTEHTYWRMEDIPPLEGDPVKLIRKQLEELSTLVVRSDVPVGVALSGGVDSSAIAALTVRTYPGVLQAFSVGYPGRPFNDERDQAKSLAHTLKIPFHEVELTTEEESDFFEELVYLRDDPIADISGFGYYAVSKKARELGVPVLMQGQGGDELFWGYEWVRQAALQTLRKQARLQSGPWGGFCYLDMMYPPSLSPTQLRDWAKTGCGIPEMKKIYQRDGDSHPDDMVFMEMTLDFVSARNETPGYYAPEFIEQVKDFPAESLHRFSHPWPDIPVTITQLISQTYLLENGIAQGDRLSMANSVELRLPFMDYRLIETVIGLRRNYPDHRLPLKYWLKEALRDLLPDEILVRPKQGFAPPVHEWHDNAFRRHGKKLADGILVQEKILTHQAAQTLATGVYPPVVVPVSFKALVLELWMRGLSS
jgi:asparagine synthase (glutamine-hydrolysing)